MANNEFKYQKWLNFFHGLLIFCAMVSFTGYIGYLFFGTEGVFWAAFMVVGISIFFPGISPNLILRIRGSQRLNHHNAPIITSIINILAKRAGLKNIPDIYYVPSQVMNAFAIGNQNQSGIGITSSLLNRMNEREITGILAHEISHIKNNDLQVMMTAGLFNQVTHFFSLAGQFLLLLNLPLIIAEQRIIPWGVIMFLIAAPTISSLLQLALSRTREFNADLEAVRLTGDPAGLANALQKLEYYKKNIFNRLFRPIGSGTKSSILLSHPDTSKRVQRLFAIGKSSKGMLAGTAHQPITRGFYHVT